MTRRAGLQLMVRGLGAQAVPAECGPGLSGQAVPTLHGPRRVGTRPRHRLGVAPLRANPLAGGPFTGGAPTRARGGPYTHARD
jgi:hypothetical protein